MRKLEIVLIAIIIVLSVTVFIEFSNGRSSSDLSQAAIQNPPDTSGSHIPSSNSDPVGSVNSTLLSTQSSSLTEIFKNTENSVVQITSKVSTVDNSIIINGQPLESQSTR